MSGPVDPQAPPAQVQTELRTVEPPTTGSLKGIVTDAARRPLSHVTMALEPGNVRKQTDGQGQFAFSGLAPGEYSLTCNHEHYEATTVTKTVLAAEEESVAVVMTTVTYSLAGAIMDDETGVAGVRVKLSGGQTTTAITDRYGDYSFPKLPALADYRLTPQKRGYNFTKPTELVNTLSANTTRDFKAHRDFYAVSGTVRDNNGDPVKEVVLKLEGAVEKTARTDETGSYSFTPAPGAQSYVIRPAKATSVFSPPIVPIPFLAGHVHQDFYASDDPTVPTDKAPNQWSALSDYSKTVITLASAVLAVTVTFSGQFTAREPDGVSNLLLILTWLSLIFAIGCGLLAAGFVVNYLRKKKSERATILCANLSYLFLFTAGALFLVMGWRSVYGRPKWDARTVIDTTLKRMPDIYKSDKPSAWKLHSLEYDPVAQTYKLIVIDDVTSTKSQVWIDSRTQQFKAEAF